MPLSLEIERFVQRQGPLTVGIGAIIGGFILCLVSAWVGVGQLPPVEVAPGIKKVFGFWSALNWSVTFLILFPMFMVLFAMQISQCKLIRQSFAETMVITGPNGAEVSPERLDEAWKSHLGGVSRIFWCLLAAVIAQACFDWWHSCGRPLVDFKLTTQTRDWSTAIILLADNDPTWKDHRWYVFAFSLVAYLYMGMALFAYLSALVYSFAFANFLHAVSTLEGEYRLVFKKRELSKPLFSYFNNIYWAVFMGLCAAFLMRVEVGYLASKQSNIQDFLFQDWDVAHELITRTVNGKPINIGVDTVEFLANLTNHSAATSLALACFSLLCLGGLTYALYMIFTNARNYLLNKVSDSTWRQAVKLPELPDATIKEAQETSFVNGVVPNALNLSLLIVLLLLSMAFIGIGVLFVAVIIYATVMLLVRRIKDLSTKPGDTKPA